MKLSIITINYNNKLGLIQTFKSIEKQVNIDYNQFEYIVIDGLSNDGSINLIKTNKIVSKYKIEKDDGIADAFNKGISFSNGEYLYFLNSGDIFYNEKSLEFILNKLKNINYDILINRIAMIDNNGYILNNAGKNINLKQQIYRNYLPHQGMLIKRDLFNKYGLYDKNYKLGMDYEWSLRLLKDIDNLNIKFIDYILCKMIEGGISQTQYINTFFAYHKARIKNNIMSFACSYAVSLFFILKRSIGLLVKKIMKKNAYN